MRLLGISGLVRNNPTLGKTGQGWGTQPGVLSKFYGQATKGAWWMPWRKMATKDVASCDKPRRAASRL